MVAMRVAEPIVTHLDTHASLSIYLCGPEYRRHQQGWRPAIARTRIALDAMGGDHAPAEPVAGAVLAVNELDVDVVLVGREADIRSALARAGGEPLLTAGRMRILHTDDVIEMAEHAANAARAKPRSSLVISARLVQSGDADAFVSAGNTGAAMAAALFTLGRVKGVERPALATPFPTISGRCLMLDVGANADCRPNYLAQFAVMGDAYARVVFGMSNPRIGLLNNGEEDTKGNQMAREAHQLLRKLSLNFVGNAEGKDVPAGLADVIVSDGFAGNVALKMAEGMAKLAFDLMRREAMRSVVTKLGAALMRPAFRGVRRHLDYEEYGGAILLGVAGVAVVAHGRSNARAVRSAIRVGKQCAEGGVVERIRTGIAASQSVLAETER